MSERRAYLAGGLFIGTGLVMIVLGFAGWFMADFVFGKLTPILLDANPNPILLYLSRTKTGYMAIMVAGVLCLLVRHNRTDSPKEELTDC